MAMQESDITNAHKAFSRLSKENTPIPQQEVKPQKQRPEAAQGF